MATITPMIQSGGWFIVKVDGGGGDGDWLFIVNSARGEGYLVLKTYRNTTTEAVESRKNVMRSD